MDTIGAKLMRAKTYEEAYELVAPYFKQWWSTKGFDRARDGGRRNQARSQRGDARQHGLGASRRGLVRLGDSLFFTWLVKTPGDLASERMSTIYDAVNLPITHPIAWTTL
jgi:hypothetical protein